MSIQRGEEIVNGLEVFDPTGHAKALDTAELRRARAAGGRGIGFHGRQPARPVERIEIVGDLIGNLAKHAEIAGNYRSAKGQRLD